MFSVVMEMSHRVTRAEGGTSKRSFNATEIPDRVFTLSSRGKTGSNDLLIIGPDVLLSFRSTMALAGNSVNTFGTLLSDIEHLEFSSLTVD